MTILVKLYATLQKGRFGEREIDVAEGASLGDLVGQLEITRRECGILLVNGEDANLESEIPPDAVVSVFPTLGGG